MRSKYGSESETPRPNTFMPPKFHFTARSGAVPRTPGTRSLISVSAVPPKPGPFTDSSAQTPLYEKQKSFQSIIKSPPAGQTPVYMWKSVYIDTPDSIEFLYAQSLFSAFIPPNARRTLRSPPLHVSRLSHTPQ